MAMTALKERPIIFTAEMVRALLAGRKTQTRRPVKPQPQWIEGATQGERYAFLYWQKKLEQVADACPKRFAEGLVKYCPYGKPGDRLWVREAYKLAKQYDHLKPGAIPFGEQVTYLADDTTTPATWRLPEAVGKRRWDKAMPRWASRLTLEITGERVERVQAITEADAIAEGVYKSQGGLWCGAPHKAHGSPTQHNDPIAAFKSIWANLYGPDPVKGWDANPWVWVVSFNCVEDQA